MLYPIHLLCQLDYNFHYTSDHQRFLLIPHTPDYFRGSHVVVEQFENEFCRFYTHIFLVLCCSGLFWAVRFGCGQWKAAAPRFSSVARRCPGIEQFARLAHSRQSKTKRLNHTAYGIRNTENNSSSVSYWWQSGPAVQQSSRGLTSGSLRFISEKCHKFINYDGWLWGQHWTFHVVGIGQANGLEESWLGPLLFGDWQLSGGVFDGVARNVRPTFKLKRILFQLRGGGQKKCKKLN